MSLDKFLKQLTTTQRQALLLFGARPTNMLSWSSLDDPFYRGYIGKSTMNALVKKGLAEQRGKGYQLTPAGTRWWNLLFWMVLEGDLSFPRN